MKKELFFLFILFSVSISGICGELFPHGQGSFNFHHKAGNKLDTIQVFYYIPSGYDRSAMPVIMGFHGNDRDCSYWMKTWKEYADKNGFMFFIPWFTHKDFPTRRYQEVGVKDENGKVVPSQMRTSALVDSLMSYVLKKSGTADSKLTVFGHSAGGQFVHRFMLVNNSPFVKKAIIGNPGWFTFPTTEEDYSYGIRDLAEIDNLRLKSMLAKNIILQLAEGDTIRESFLRKTPEADRQGFNRLERGNNFFNSLKEIADKNKWDFNWRKVYVPNVGHDAVAMSRFAAENLINDSITILIPNEEPAIVASDWLYRFDDEIDALVRKSTNDSDTICDAIFVGSSSIRLWHNLYKEMYPLIVKNRGYGGAMMRDLLINYRRVMAHYKPKSIVFYCDNDICGWKEGDLSVNQVFALYQQFIEKLNNILVSLIRA